MSDYIEGTKLMVKTSYAMSHSEDTCCSLSVWCL